MAGKVLIFDLDSCLPYHNSLSYIFLCVNFVSVLLYLKSVKNQKKKKAC